MPIRWQPYLWEQPRPFEAGGVDALELAWGVKLPAQYKEFVLQYQGMTPEPGVFRIGRSRNVFSVLLSVSVEEEYTAYSIGFVHGVIKQHVPPGIYPFGMTPGGEYLCLDYRDSLEDPHVVLVTVEMSIFPVAHSFQVFMDGLYDGEEKPL